MNRYPKVLSASWQYFLNRNYQPPIPVTLGLLGPKIRKEKGEYN